MTDSRMNFHDAAAPKIAPRILCIGMPVRDLTFRVQGLPARGSKEHASHFDEICGGNALNGAIGIVRLGGRASICGPMGDARETTSRYIFEKLADEGIDTRHIVHMPGLVTPISNIMIDPSGERTIVTFRDPELWKVHTASSHLVFSSEPLQETAGVAEDGEALKKIAKLTPSFLAGTRGALGTIWLDEHQNLQQTPAFAVHTVDTLGAGDVFHGAFALAITENQDLPEALRFASAAAALKCTRFGGAFAAPQRAEVDELLSHNQTPGPARVDQ